MRFVKKLGDLLILAIIILIKQSLPTLTITMAFKIENKIQKNVCCWKLLSLIDRSVWKKKLSVILKTFQFLNSSKGKISLKKNS